ncbi:hypothetical protein Ndes2437B_g08220 [Nannochloris sp. 'desiccata']|nr:hypothetical protein KSW81_001269 [Chlorella desiccata (nom. nud.)]
MLDVEKQSDSPPVDEESHILRDNPRKTQCQVEGCRIALPKRRAYHKRYRICNYHATLSQMVLEGRHMRFCQQCGRFQLLSEFEGDKRSCRAKLDLHNARRKQAREAASRPRYLDDANSSSPRKLQNSKNMPTGLQMTSVTHRSTDCLHPSWKFVPSFDENDGEDEGGGTSVPRPTGQRNAGGAGGWGAIRPEHDLDKLLKDLAADGVLHPSNGHPTEKYITHGNINEDAQATTVDELLGQVYNAPILPSNLPGPSSAAEIDDSMMHYHHTLDDVQFTAVPAPRQVHLAHAPRPQQPPLVHPQQQHHLNSYQIAEELLSNHDQTNPAVNYEASYDLARVSFKLFNVHPSELPAGMSAELQNILQNSSYLTYNARIGCTHLSVETLLSRREITALESGGSLGLLENAISQSHSFFPRHTFEGPDGKVVAQIGSDVSLKAGARDIVTLRIIAGSSTALCVKQVMPVAVVTGKAAKFRLYGSNISGTQDMVVCRQGPNLPDLEVIGAVNKHAFEFNNSEVVEFVLPHPAEGLHFVEVQRGSLLSSTAVPFLVIDNEDVVKELRQLEYDTAGVGDAHAVAAFVKNVGVVLDWTKASPAAAAAAPSSSTSLTTTDNNKDGEDRIAEVAQRVVATCIVRGWPALLGLILPAMVPPGTDPATVIENFKSYSKQGLSMLHLAVLSRCAAVVQVIADWSSDSRRRWICEPAPAAGGLTPLHLACLINDEGAMASALTSVYPEGIKLWTRSFTYDQARPLDFAISANNTPILIWLKKQGVIPQRARRNDDEGEDSGSSGSGSPTRWNKYGPKKEVEIMEASSAKNGDATAVLAGTNDVGNNSKDVIDVGTEVKGRGGSRRRSEQERLRLERKNRYLDTVCQAMQLVDDELRALSRSTTTGQGRGNDGGEEEKNVLLSLVPRGALVVAAAGTAALVAYLRTMQL